MSVSRLSTVTPAELSNLLNAGQPVVVIDVREQYEFEYARIPNALLMPLGSLPRAAADLDRDSDVVVYCHHGMRSETAGYALLGAGFQQVRNLVGGIDRWSRDVDPLVPQY